MKAYRIGTVPEYQTISLRQTMVEEAMVTTGNFKRANHLH